MSRLRLNVDTQFSAGSWLQSFEFLLAHSIDRSHSLRFSSFFIIFLFNFVDFIPLEFLVIISILFFLSRFLYFNIRKNFSFTLPLLFYPRIRGKWLLNFLSDILKFLKYQQIIIYYYYHNGSIKTQADSINVRVLISTDYIAAYLSNGVRLHVQDPSRLVEYAFQDCTRDSN